MTTNDVRVYMVVGVISLEKGDYQIDTTSKSFIVSSPLIIPQIGQTIMVTLDADSQIPTKMDIVNLVSYHVRRAN